MIKCCDCNKPIKTKARFLKTCRDCGLPSCASCRVEGYCKACHPANADEKVIYAYYKDKYLSNMVRPV